VTEEALALQETVLKMSKPESQDPWKQQNYCLMGSRRAQMGDKPPYSQARSRSLDDENDLAALHPAFDRDWLVKLISLPYLRPVDCFAWISMSMNQ
jgi:hypothetical protein